MVLRVLLDIFLIYLAYQFIFNFLVPVFRTTQQVKKGFREMSARMNNSEGHQHMNDQQTRNQHSSPPPQSSNGPAKNDAGEYIDFEEVK